ncbi:MAG: four helix bundle protein [Cytophagales bacterium]|nr:four helix bundle protein [Cytophagales bacterium]MCA6368296.1 four helix bundle protein [Cytophagales bacterium]MCA6371112.1 four helix bundle protein [Cytophagales bacterium]MCA6377455.1 four helix bundle protein [Cytophagales bacterium]MCA6382943.1 four helix bundle protein [Cytophagales bacterium]
MKDFKKLLIWQLGMEIVDRVYDIVPMLPQEERYGLRSQIARSAVSIPSNIAEGSAKRSTKEKIKYVEISQGSAFELETQLLAVQKRKWVTETTIDETIGMVRKEQSMISKFIEKLESEL